MMGEKPIALSVLIGCALFARADKAIPGDECPSMLTADVAVRDCGILTVSGVVDVNGHTLRLQGLAGLDSDGKGEITDRTTDARNPGSLQLELEEDLANGNVLFSGNLRLVVDGGHVFGARKLTQTYSGGNVVSNGTLMIDMSGNSLAIVTNTPLGARCCRVDVGPMGTFDTKGKYGFDGNCSVTLHGGRVLNTAQRNRSTAFNPALTLTADSIFANVGKDKIYGFAAAGTLGGHTLTVEIESLLYWQPQLSNGTVWTRGSKALQVTADTDMRTVNFVQDAPLDLGESVLSVSNYVANCLLPSLGSGTLRVYGTFSPNAGCYFPPEMQDGSTIDLSDWTDGAWPLTRTDAGEETQGTVGFADRATVALDTGGRVLTNGMKVVNWEAQSRPANLDTLTFAFRGAAADARFKAEKRADGVYAVRRWLTIAIR